MQLKKCPICNSSQIRQVCEDFKVSISVKKIVVPDVQWQKCFSCGEEFFDHVSNAKLDAYRRR